MPAFPDVTAVQVAGITLQYWVNVKKSRSSSVSQDSDLALKLWDVSLHLTKADYSLLDA